MESFFEKIGMPVRLSAFGLDEKCLDRLSDLCTYQKTRTVKSYIDMDYDVIKDIYKLCL